MTRDELKSIFYRRDTIASLVLVSKDGVTYECKVDTNMSYINIIFIIPTSDIGNDIFLQKMPAKYLIRWAVINETL